MLNWFCRMLPSLPLGLFSCFLCSPAGSNSYSKSKEFDDPNSMRLVDENQQRGMFFNLLFLLWEASELDERGLFGVNMLRCPENPHEPVTEPKQCPGSFEASGAADEVAAL